MSKLDIGVGEEFPLQEGESEPGRHAFRHTFRHGHRGHRRHGHHHHSHHHGHHRQAGRGFLHLPLIVGVAAIAAMIGAGKIPVLATHVILALAGVLILLAVIAHFTHHRRWHQRTQGQPE
jgi:hypothetical protein